jgi:hypothetical protein
MKLRGIIWNRDLLLKNNMLLAHIRQRDLSRAKPYVVINKYHHSSGPNLNQ